MADVRPFRGLRYDPEAVGDLGAALAPPYDVVTPERERQLRETGPYNAVRLELGAQAGDDPDRYAAAAMALHAWRESEALVRDERPAFYLTDHEFDHGGRRAARAELMALVRLASWSEGSVLPHENTRGGPKRDRLDLMRACRANLSPVMALYSDPDASVRRLLDGARAAGPDGPVLTGPDGDRYRVTAVGGDAADAIAAALSAAGPLYVADGHHRYETALDYRAEVRAAGGQGNAADYLLASLIALQDEGLLSLPYHRVLHGLAPDATARWGRQMDVDFTSETVDVAARPAREVAAVFEEHAARLGGPALAVLGRDRPGVMRLLRPRPADQLQGLMRGRSEAWARLSPCIFEDVLLRPALGMNHLEAEAAGLLSYPGSAHEAVAAVREGSADDAVLLDGVPLEGMTAVSEEGERLPPKSTYFYPKLPTGIVFNLLEGAV